MTASDIVAGGRYRGGKAGRIRVVTSIYKDGELIWWKPSTAGSNYQTCSMETFLKWAKERV